MTDTLIALLRGINVGRANRVAMADLRSLLEGLGFSAVRTLLNSGNAVFQAPAGTSRDAAVRIAAGLAEGMGVHARVVVIDEAGLARAIAGNPLLDVAHDPARLLVAFPCEPADLRRLLPLLEVDWKPEAIAVGEDAAYLWCANGVADSAVAKAMGKALGDTVTARNWTTVLKLESLAHVVTLSRSDEAPHDAR